MKKLIIMAGLPASGKSTYRMNHKDIKNLAVVDSDEIKKTLEGYDPKDPQMVHAQSKMIEKAKLYNYLSDGISFVYDTTATNSDKVIRITKQAQELGYTVSIIYLNTTLATCLERNANRTRNVPESILVEKSSLIRTSIEISKKFVDKFIEVNAN
jgi:predicted kinase